MSPDEVQAVSRLSPSLAPYIVLAVPMLGALLLALHWVPMLPAVRGLCVRLFGWDPAVAPQDEASRRLLALADQQREEVVRYSETVARYSAEIDKLREARIAVLQQLGELRAAAIAARTMVHTLERQAGLPETAFDPLPGIGMLPEAAMRG